MGTKKGRIYGEGAPFKGAPQTFAGGSSATGTKCLSAS